MSHKTSQVKIVTQAGPMTHLRLQLLLATTAVVDIATQEGVSEIKDTTLDGIKT